MYTFMFTVLVTSLFFSNTVYADDDDDDADDSRLCDKTLFPDATTEIHSILARDRYINFTGWISKDDITGDPNSYYYEALKNVGTEDISYGYLKEMLIHLNSISEEGRIEARVFLTSGDKLWFVKEINFGEHGIPLREWFLKFTLFIDGIKIEHRYIKQDGTDGASIDAICHEYHGNEYPQIDGLLIAINCKTTNIKKILVKVIPKEL